MDSEKGQKECTHTNKMLSTLVVIVVAVSKPKSGSILFLFAYSNFRGQTTLLYRMHSAQTLNRLFWKLQTVIQTLCEIKVGEFRDSKSAINALRGSKD